MTEVRRTGKTTRAILKVARWLSKGKLVVLCSYNFGPTPIRHFMERLTELCGNLGFLEGRSYGRILAVGGGRLILCRSPDSLRGLREYKEVTEI